MFWLLFHIAGNGTEWIDQGLPQPSYHELINRGYLIGYALDGFFGTSHGTDYLNDMIARFLFSFKDYKPQRLHHKPTIGTNSIYLPKIYKLQELQALRSLETQRKAPQRADSFKDVIFWSIKLFCEDLIRKQSIPTFEQLQDFAVSNFIQKKSRSTLKAKCRSVWNYYEQRDWKISTYTRKCTKEQYMATRQENMKKVNQNQIIKNRNKIKAVLDDIFLQDDIKFKNGKYRIGKIAELTEIHRETVAKYLKEFDLV